MAVLTLTIDGHPVKGETGMTILDAADASEIYIPRLCHHPDLPEIRNVVWSNIVYQGEIEIVGQKYDGQANDEVPCNLCVVEIEGEVSPVNACCTPVADGMVIHTRTGTLSALRRKSLSKILKSHPHACLTCAQKEGCSRVDCSSNVPVNERCCPLLGNCELEKISDFVGIAGDTPKYVPKARPVTVDDPLILRDFGLCIGCLRCVRVCNDVRGAEVLGTTWRDGRAQVGTLVVGDLREAECRFCSACVEVCPTGALRDQEDAAVRASERASCVSNCPLEIDIPRYVRLIAQGRHREALDLIRTRTPFPAILGYVCFHPCEDNCRRGKLDQPVAICALKRFAAETELEEEHTTPERHAETDKSIAIIGAGPTGITAAYYLALCGHGVDIFDEASRPGGMLRRAIPDYRLPASVLDRELRALGDLGVTFHQNQRLGGDMTIGALRESGFDAILVAAGTPLSKALPLDNADLDGIHLGLDFLREAKGDSKPALCGKVVVIGGGNVAIDAAMTAVRLGAENVRIVCLESRDEMPAHLWEIAQAEEEGIEILNSWGPKDFLSDSDRVCGLELKRCTCVFDEQGRFRPEYDEAEISRLDADHVIVTIGQEVDRRLMVELDDVGAPVGRGLKTDGKFELGPEGLFAAGDVVRGPSSVVDAMAQGRRVADQIDRFLGGSGLADELVDTTIVDNPKLDTWGDTFRHPRQVIATADPNERKFGFDLIEGTFPDVIARAEAQRCLQCHLRKMITPVILPPELWLPLTVKALASVPDDEGVYQLLNAEKEVIRISGTPNLRQSLNECLDDPGEASYFVYVEDPMYTKRESELIQQYLQAHGELPGGGVGGDDLDDLF